MDLNYGPEIDAFRTGVRTFLQDNWRPEGRCAAELSAYVRAFRVQATDAGYIYRGVPRRYGGAEQPVDVIRGQTIREEFRRARAPAEVIGNAITMLVPTLLDQGTEKQRQHFIPPALAGDHVWAQGYSEPGSGSDLASLRTQGELVGDEWVINGEKIWTSHGDRANYMFALVRTEPDAPKHAGISYLLIDLKQPGVTVRPLRQINGGAEFSAFFFDDVRTPADWIVGKRGQGWTVSRTTLKHERASIGSADTLGALFDKLVELARMQLLDGAPAIGHVGVRDTLMKIEGWILAHRCSSYRLLSLAAADEEPGMIGAMMKLLSSEIGHDVAALAQTLLCNHCLIEPEPAEVRKRGPEKWLDQVMGALGNSIAGGTSNIHRNIIAERWLGLPRDLAADLDR